eukprot:6186173-Pleurochrysis_carterae.AAC.3
MKQHILQRGPADTRCIDTATTASSCRAISCCSGGRAKTCVALIAPARELTQLRRCHLLLHLELGPSRSESANNVLRACGENRGKHCLAARRGSALGAEAG